MCSSSSSSSIGLSLIHLFFLHEQNTSLTFKNIDIPLFAPKIMKNKWSKQSIIAHFVYF